MERDTNQMSQSSSLCRSGCGFYGSPATDGLCSKCYKDALKRKQSAPSTSPSSSSTTSSNSSSNTSVVSGRNSPIVVTSKERLKSATDERMNKQSAVSSNDSGSTTAMSSAADCPLSTASPTVPTPASTSSAQDTSKEGTSQETAPDVESAVSPSEDSRDSSPLNPEDDDTQPKEQKKKKNRCMMCRKKVGLTGFQCRCGGLFCSIHRYSNEHNCSFDYKELGAQEIRKNNPLVVGEKIQKI